MRVSVILIFFNEEKFLSEAVESVIGQSFDDWELLLVDDGSSDASTAIAKGYAQSDPDRIRYLEHDNHRNRGMSATRNLGISHAKGEFIAFVDADDVWLPDKLSDQVGILEGNPDADMVFGRPLYWSEWPGSDQHTKDIMPDLGFDADRLYRPKKLIKLCYPLRKTSAPCPSDLLIRTPLVKEVGGFEEEFTQALQMYEDQAFLAKIYLKAGVFVSGKCWLKYRLRKDSACCVIFESGRYREVRMYFLNWLIRYLSAENHIDPKLRYLAYSAKWRCQYPAFDATASRLLAAAASTGKSVKAAVRRILPSPVFRWLRTKWKSETSPVWVDFGDLRSTRPVCAIFGMSRGTPVDRYYIENFLQENAAHIRGRVLEIGEKYTRQFGAEKVTKSDVFHVDPGDPAATIIGDLTKADHVPSCAFDCVILTQTLQCIFDVQAALATIHRILKPGGVLLMTVPGITQQVGQDWGNDWYWSFTTQSVNLLLKHAFPDAAIEIRCHGNVLTSISFLEGISAEELTKEELDHTDKSYEMLITASVRKA